MKIVTLNEEEFNELSSNHKYGNMYQSSAWGHIQSNNGYHLHFLGFKNDNNELFGGCMVLYKELFWGYKFAYAPRGLLIDYENPNEIKMVSRNLKNLLNKQKFIFLKIDPCIVYCIRDENGNIVDKNEDSNKIFNYLKRNGFVHLGFNVYNETMLPRWNAYCMLDKDINDFYDVCKDKINSAKRRSVEVLEDTDIDIEDFYNIIKDQFKNKKKDFFVDIFNEYNKYKKVKVYYGLIDSSTFVQKANEVYNKEFEKNLALGNIIEKGDNTKYNIPKVINDKIESDKLLDVYKQDIVKSTELLRKYPEGIICSTSMIIEDKDIAHMYINYDNKEHASCNAYAMLISELYKLYSNKGFKYLDLGPVTGNFDSNSKQYSLIKNKIGYNSMIYEFLGEFNLVINPIMYQVYKRKIKKK